MVHFLLGFYHRIAEFYGIYIDIREVPQYTKCTNIQINTDLSN